MKVKKVIGRSLLVLLCIVVVIAIIGIAQFHHRSNPKNLKQYETNNPFITGETAISAHRSEIRILRWIILNLTCI